jgi:hypothetical protein
MKVVIAVILRRRPVLASGPVVIEGSDNLSLGTSIVFEAAGSSAVDFDLALISDPTPGPSYNLKYAELEP